MVKTKSVDNYEQFLIELEQEFTEKYGDKHTKIFIRFVKDRYDKFNRVFLDKNIMWKAMDDYSAVRNGNMISYLVVGLGLTGKSTFFKNLAYFYDTNFHADMLVWGFHEMVEKIADVVDSDNPYRSIIIDEPSDIDHPQSKAGRKFKEIMGQLRQQCPVLLYCSTDFKDMPPTVISKLNGLFYLNTLGQGYFIRNEPENNSYPLDEFKKKFKEQGYKVFSELFKKYSFLNFITHKDCVLDILDPEGEKKYFKVKKEKLKNSIKMYKNIKKRASGSLTLLSDEKRIDRNDMIIALWNDGMRQVDICRKLKLKKALVSTVIKECNV